MNTIHANESSRKIPFHIDQDDIIDLVDLAERVASIAPAVGRLHGNRVIRVDPNDPIAISKARAAIADRYDAIDQRRPTTAPATEENTLRMGRVARKRIADLECYLWHRYGRQVPDDDAGREDLAILLKYIGRNPIEPRTKVLASIRVWARWMPRDDAEAMADEALARPRRYKATTLGRMLRLTRDEAAAWGIETIRPHDKTDAEMAQEQKHKNRERKRAKRAAKKSGRPRGRPKKDGAEPWIALGKSRATYFRHKARDTGSETKNVSGPYSLNNGGDAISVSPESAPVLEPIILPAPIEERRAHEARRRLAPIQPPIPETVEAEGVDVPPPWVSEHARFAGATRLRGSPSYGRRNYRPHA
jgi:hypothetical protein